MKAKQPTAVEMQKRKAVEEKSSQPLALY